MNSAIQTISARYETANGAGGAATEFLHLYPALGVGPLGLAGVGYEDTLVWGARLVGLPTIVASIGAYGPYGTEATFAANMPQALLNPTQAFGFSHFSSNIVDLNANVLAKRPAQFVIHSFAVTAAPKTVTPGVGEIQVLRASSLALATDGVSIVPQGVWHTLATLRLDVEKQYDLDLRVTRQDDIAAFRILLPKLFVGAATDPMSVVCRWEPQ